MNDSDDIENTDSDLDSVHDAYNSPYISRKKYIRKKIIESYAKLKFERTGKGFTYEDFVNTFDLTKESAQRSIRHLLEAKIIFSARDLEQYGIKIHGLKSSRPQQYYSTKMKSTIIEKFKKTYIENSEPNDALLVERKNVLVELLSKIGFGPLCIHKLQLKTTFDKKEFMWLEKEEDEKNTVIREMTFDFHHFPRRVTFYIYSNGTLMTYINCSNYPIKIENEEDIEKFYIWLGRIEYHIDVIFYDSRRETIPSIREWILQNYDINKDMEINTMCQLTIPNIQLKEMNQVFRMYVKAINDKCYLRAEESVTSNSTLGDSLRDIIGRNTKSGQETNT